MTRSVLAIDEDAAFLSALCRQFDGVFDIATAQGSEEALRKIRARTVQPGVIVCGLRLAGRDGVGTLAALQEAAPDAPRLMLAGNADLRTAIDAINEMHVFRFLTKPCPFDTLRSAIEAGLEQHRLVTAERDLLEKTLAGSVKVLTDILALVSPEAFSRAGRAAAWVQELGRKTLIEAHWQLNLAALLSPVGLVSLPPDIVAKLQARARLTELESAMVRRAPDCARRLIANIPRLKPVADIVYLQNRGFDGSGFPDDGPSGRAIPFDARLLHILTALAAVSAGIAPGPADFAVLYSHAHCYDPDLLERVRAGLEAHAPPAAPPLHLGTWQLLPGMYLAEAVTSQHGHLLLAGGIQLSEMHVDRLRHLAQYGQIKDRVAVHAAADGHALR